MSACISLRSQRNSALSGSAISSTEAYQCASQSLAGRPANSTRFSGHASLSAQRRKSSRNRRVGLSQAITSPNYTITPSSGCSALGFLDSGLTVFAPTLPRPA